MHLALVVGSAAYFPPIDDAVLPQFDRYTGEDFDRFTESSAKHYLEANEKHVDMLREAAQTEAKDSFQRAFNFTGARMVRLSDAHPPRKITHGGNDGLGHQLLGVFSCMLLARLRPDAIEYVHRARRHAFTGHGCKGCIDLYDALHAGWGRAETEHEAESVDNCWGGVVNHCGGEWPNVTLLVEPSPQCDEERRALSMEWRGNLLRWEAENDYEFENAFDVVVHLRSGHATDEMDIGAYAALLTKFTDSQLRIGVLTEEGGNAEDLVKAYPKAELLPDDGTLYGWLAMTNAAVLVVHESSFSVSAAIVRNGTTFSLQQHPLQGRYDMHRFVCRDGQGFFYETGGYGNASCHWFTTSSHRSRANTSVSTAVAVEQL